MRLALDISPSLHRTLSERAERYGMTLELWVADLLAKQVVAPVAPTRSPTPTGSLADWLASAERMTAEDAQAIDDAIAWMDAADLSSRPPEAAV